MQRKIKFRGKEVDTGKWVYGGLFKEPAPPQCFEKTLEDKYWIVYPNPRYMPDWNLPYQMVRTDVDKDTLGQYTGLKDKNAKEIYEGDIVKFRFKEDREEFPDLIGYIEYQSTFAAFRIMSNQGSFKIDITEIKFIEVIGNIYDNKNLLEEGEKKYCL